MPLDPNSIELIEVNGKTYLETAANNFEALKYYHNVDMLQKNKYLLGAESVLGILIAYVAFSAYPKAKGCFKESQPPGLILISFVGVFVSAAMPLFYSFILPSGAEWLPQVFLDINESQVNDLLKKLN